MKKIVEVVTIPLDKEYYSKGDLLLFINTRSETEEYSIAEKEGLTEVRDSFFQVHQLLVLSDDEIQEGDVKHSRNCEPYKKVIASYPQIEGTLPISQEFIQQYVQSQGEGVVYMETHKRASKTIPIAYNTNWVEEVINTDKAGNAVLSIEQEVNTQPLGSSTEVVNNEAIAFADWLFQNTYEARWKNNEKRYLNQDATSYTSKELYNIWQQTKKQ